MKRQCPYYFQISLGISIGRIAKIISRKIVKHLNEILPRFPLRHRQVIEHVIATIVCIGSWNIAFIFRNETECLLHTTINILDGVRYCIEDLDGSIWIATSSGPLLLTKDQMDSENPVLTQVKVPRNDGTDYADYLLAGIDITSIAIDGAGRKWFGTNGNGVYLISADNMEQVQHFTTTNSCLLSDIILSISINPSTGEVFFGTDKGLCSYVSDATEPSEEMTKDNVYAYPNPVDFNNYNGYITITGLTFNADVKIMSSYGTLVNEGHSNGGTYVWDGCDQKGKRVASGIYMVATATSNGEKGTVCKIAIVR